MAETDIGMNNDMISNFFCLGAKTNPKDTEDESSTWLGFIIRNDFIERNRGQLSIESEVGVGSIFNFTIPHISESEKFSV